MAEQLVVIGAGGFARETLDVVDAINDSVQTQMWDVVGVVDDKLSEDNASRIEARGVRHLGDLAALIDRLGRPHYVVGIGSPAVRRRIAERLDSAGFRAATLVHPTATTGFAVEVGEGTVICAGVRLTTNIRLGRHVHLNLNATVGHDTVVGDFVSVNPLASISGDCSIGSDVLIGVAGVVLNGLSVGDGSIVGGSACAVRDVPAGVVVKGVPAKQ